MKVKKIGMTYVKCTRFLNPPTARLEKYGIVGDRAFMLLDANGAPMPPYHHGRFAPLKFDFESGEETLRLEYPDGRVITASGAMVGPTFTIDYLGMRSVEVRAIDARWNAIVSEFGGRVAQLVRPVKPGEGIDVAPITLVTTASLSVLASKIGSPVDDRRFRANLVIESEMPFIEDSWSGRLLKVGDAILRVRGSVPRCVVTQFDPDHGTNDLNIVPALGKFRQKVHLPDGLMPEYSTPGFASYAEVIESGALNVGDAVSLS